MSGDGVGRRIKKAVSNSGDLDGTWVYYYNGHQMIEAVDVSALAITLIPEVEAVPIPALGLRQVADRADVLARVPAVEGANGGPCPVVDALC